MSIPGVPLGAKIVRIDHDCAPNEGEYMLWQGSVVKVRDGFAGLSNGGWVIVAPDNPYGKFLHEVEADIKAAGRERLGGDDYRQPQPGEWYWNDTDGAIQRCHDAIGPYPFKVLILKPRTRLVLVVECKEPWHNGIPAELTVVFHGQRVEVISHRIEERPV